MIWLTELLIYLLSSINFASDYLEKKRNYFSGTIFEFGIDDKGDLILIDEAITPDSSRFWLKESYASGKLQYNLDSRCSGIISNR